MATNKAARVREYVPEGRQQNWRSKVSRMFSVFLGRLKREEWQGKEDSRTRKGGKSEASTGKCPRQSVVTEAIFHCCNLKTAR